MDILDFIQERIIMVITEIESNAKCSLDWCNNMLSVVVYILKKINDWPLIFQTVKIYGQIFQLMKKHQDAIQTFEILRDIAYEMDD